MAESERAFVALVLVLGVVIFGLPFVGGVATATLFGGIQVGVAIAWAGTLVIPLLILAHEFTGIGGGV